MLTPANASQCAQLTSKRRRNSRSRTGKQRERKRRRARDPTELFGEQTSCASPLSLSLSGLGVSRALARDLGE